MIRRREITCPCGHKWVSQRALVSWDRFSCRKCKQRFEVMGRTGSELEVYPLPPFTNQATEGISKGQRLCIRDL